MVRYAIPLTLEVKAEDAVFNALRKHFNTTEIVELTSAIATYNMVARFLVAMGWRKKLELQLQPQDRNWAIY